MKISGSGSEVFKRFYQSYRKSKNFKNQSTMTVTPMQIAAAKSYAKKLMAYKDSVFTRWEDQVRKKLKNSKIKFETKFRTFPILLDGEKIFEYCPGFILKDRSIKDRKILIEAHEFLTEKIGLMHSIFLESYGSQYYIIMIVTDNELRKWNEWKMSEGKIFDDIWTVNDLNFFIKSLTKYKTELPNNEKNTAIQQQITKEKIFSEILKSSEQMTCIGCKRSFKTVDYGQPYCPTCLKKF